jgi:hypothetical protein
MKRTSIAAYPAISAVGARPCARARGFVWSSIAGADLSLTVETKHMNQPAWRFSRQPT